MRRRAIIVVLLSLIVIHYAGPAFELADRWDNFPQSGNDTLHTLIALVTLLGAMFVLAKQTGVISGSFRLIGIAQSLVRPNRSDHRSSGMIRLESLPPPGLSALRI